MNKDINFLTSLFIYKEKKRRSSEVKLSNYRHHDRLYIQNQECYYIDIIYIGYNKTVPVVVSSVIIIVLVVLGKLQGISKRTLFKLRVCPFVPLFLASERLYLVLFLFSLHYRAQGLNLQQLKQYDDDNKDEDSNPNENINDERPSTSKKFKQKSFTYFGT